MILLKTVKIRNIIDDKIKKNKSTYERVSETSSVARIEATPVIPKILNKFDPKIAPSIKFTCPL